MPAALPQSCRRDWQILAFSLTSLWLPQSWLPSLRGPLLHSPHSYPAPGPEGAGAVSDVKLGEIRKEQEASPWHRELRGAGKQSQPSVLGGLGRAERQPGLRPHNSWVTRVASLQLTQFQGPPRENIDWVICVPTCALCKDSLNACYVPSLF